MNACQFLIHTGDDSAISSVELPRVKLSFTCVRVLFRVFDNVFFACRCNLAENTRCVLMVLEMQNACQWKALL